MPSVLCSGSHCQVQCHDAFSLFSSWRFTVPGLPFRSLIDASGVNFCAWCQIRVQFYCFACGFPVFPAQPPKETKAPFNSKGRGRIFGKGTGLHTLGSPPPPTSPRCLLQVHKFLNRNRDHLDPAVVEMLAQSQLQVPLPALRPCPSALCPPPQFRPSCRDTLAQGASLKALAPWAMA